MLDWDNPIEIQEQGVLLGREEKDIRYLLQPGIELKSGKNVWDNCAKILEQKSDEELQPYLKELLEWLQDLTWPGAMTILNRLMKFQPDMLLPELESAIKNAQDMNMLTWIEFLSYLLKNKELEKKINPECIKIIELVERKIAEEEEDNI